MIPLGVSEEEALRRLCHPIKETAYLTKVNPCKKNLGVQLFPKWREFLPFLLEVLFLIIKMSARGEMRVGVMMSTCFPEPLTCQTTAATLPNKRLVTDLLRVPSYTYTAGR